MNDHDHVFADPWLKKGKEGARLPDDARLACAYELFVTFEYFDEAAFFRRTESTDELWTGYGAYPPARAGTDRTASAKEERKEGRTSREADRPLELPFCSALRSFLLRPVRTGCYAENDRDRKRAGGRR